MKTLGSQDRRQWRWCDIQAGARRSRVRSGAVGTEPNGGLLIAQSNVPPSWSTWSGRSRISAQIQFASGITLRTGGVSLLSMCVIPPPVVRKFAVVAAR